MFSSLPGASKIYGSSSVKSKQKSAVNSTKRKRRRPKVQTSVSSDIDTLVGATKSSCSDDLDSETSETAPNCIVSFCLENGSEFLERVVDMKSTPEYEKYPPIIEPENSCDEVDALEPDVEPITKLANVAGDNNDSNVIVTAVEVHYDSSFEQTSEDLNSIPTSSSGELNKIFNGTPIIIISSADSPRNSIDMDNELIESLPSVNSEKKDFARDRFMSSSKCTSYATIVEDQESEESFQNDSDNNNSTSNLPTVEQSVQNSHEADNQAVIPENGCPDPVNDQNDNDNNDNDNESIKSDCYPSKDIYNEYFTDAVDETDDNFMIDDSKVSSSSDGLSSSSSESDMENPRSESPRLSEASGTESSFDAHRKQAMSENINHRSQFVPIKEVEPLVAKASNFLGNSEDGKAIHGETHRTKSLPDFLQFHTIDSVTEGESEPMVKFRSNASMVSCEDKQIPNGYRASQARRRHRAAAQLPKSTQSSSSEFSSESSVLPPVTVQEARLRSFMVGSVRATGSLLGADELARYFPEKKVNIFVGTWNMNGQNPPVRIDDFLLPWGISHLPDIYAVGVQEGSQPWSEWEILMQTTLGPSHVLLMSSSLGVLHLAVFIRRDLVWFCSEPESANCPTRPGSMVKTKGAVAISFMLFGTSFLFLNSHLTAHEKKLKERLCDYEKICNLIDLPRNIPLKPQQQNKDVTSRFDNVFWCGDLNFRVVRDRPSVLSFVQEKLQQSLHTCEFLLKHDQLHRAMNEGVAFHGFQEGNITFVPSYKFDIGTTFFNSKKQRVPSYTDRVLFRCRREGDVNCLHYNVVPNILTSDHKPVYAVFEVDIRPGRDNIPLAAGRFKREIYIEANRRRATALEIKKSNQKNSTVCNVM